MHALWCGGGVYHLFLLPVDQLLVGRKEVFEQVFLEPVSAPSQFESLKDMYMMVIYIYD